MLRIVESDLKNHLEDQKTHDKELIAPQDDYWHFGIINKGLFYSIYDNETYLGYFVLNEQKELLQYYTHLTSYKKACAVFEKIVDAMGIQYAYVQTYDPFYMNLCMDHGLQYAVEAYFYQVAEEKVLESPIFVEESIADIRHLDSLVDFIIEDESEKAWQEAYLKELMDKEALYVYHFNGSILGIGELRTHDETPGIGYIGMIVGAQYRRKGYGSYILYRMKRMALSKGLTPVCGTDFMNIASQRTIEKAGFKPYHRALKIKLK